MISVDALLMTSYTDPFDIGRLQHVSLDGGATHSIQMYKEFSMKICFVQRINNIGIVILLQAADYEPSSWLRSLWHLLLSPKR
jgi:hypothetical protein